MYKQGVTYVLKRLVMVSSLSSARPLVSARFSSLSFITSCSMKSVHEVSSVDLTAHLELAYLLCTLLALTIASLCQGVQCYSKRVPDCRSSLQPDILKPARSALRQGLLHVILHIAREFMEGARRLNF